MKTVFNISPRFPIEPRLVKEYVRFCIGQALPICHDVGLLPPKQITFKCQRSSWDRSGRARRNVNKRFACSNAGVLLKVNRVQYRWYQETYHRYKDSPKCWVYGTMEMFVHLAAHELGHAICGFAGDKTGEFQCERFAARCLEAWRIRYQPEYSI